MTTQRLATSRPGVFAEIDARFIPNLLGALRRAWSRNRVYSRTHAELRALSIRQREDLGFAGRDLAAIAREATVNT